MDNIIGGGSAFVIHSIWIGGVCFGVAVAALKLIDARRTRARHHLLCGALFCMVVVPAAFAVESIAETTRSESRNRTIAAEPAAMVDSSVDAYEPSRRDLAQTQSAPAFNDYVTERTQAAWLDQVTLRPPARLNQLLAMMWFGGFVLMVGRYIFAWYKLRALRKTCKVIADETLAERFERSKQRAGVASDVALLQTALVNSPVTLGVLRPAIVLPTRYTVSMKPSQIDAVFAHELGHIKLLDMWVHVFEQLVKAMLFFHPAVRWMVHHLRREREHRCDAFAVRCGCDPLELAEAIMNSERLRRGEAVVLAFRSNMPTAGRVRRLLNADTECPRFTSRVGAVCCGTIGSLTCVIISAFLLLPPLHLSAGQDEEASEALNKTVFMGNPAHWESRFLRNHVMRGGDEFIAIHLTDELDDEEYRLAVESLLTEIESAGSIVIHDARFREGMSEALQQEVVDRVSSGSSDVIFLATGMASEFGDDDALIPELAALRPVRSYRRESPGELIECKIEVGDERYAFQSGQILRDLELQTGAIVDASLTIDQRLTPWLVSRNHGEGVARLVALDDLWRLRAVSPDIYADAWSMILD